MVNQARKEAKEFVGSGNLRYCLDDTNLSEEAKQKIIDACSFVLKV